MDDKRSVNLSVEVPGTPEEVWDAIATGPGLSIWFVPSEVEAGEGGTVTMHHGMMDQTGTITAWEPPHRFAFGVGEFQPPGAASAAALALEILVEARSGGTCVVRLVNSGFSTDADWDRQFESSRRGWEMCLEVLRLYLRDFKGMPHAAAHAMTQTSGEPADAFARLRAAVAGDGAPWLAGTLEQVGDTALTMVLDQPAPGIAVLAVGGPGDELYATVSLSLFGDDAATVAARIEPEWQGWLSVTL